MDVEALLARAAESLERGAFPEALRAVDEAFSSSPDRPRVREVFANVYLAHGVRLASVARERRRAGIEARGVPGRPYEDSEETREAFREALAAFDRALEADPDRAKALALRGQLRFRLDRANRDDALAAYDAALGALGRTMPEGPELERARRNLEMGRRRIEAPCDWCDDTGFCTECGGSGWRRTLLFSRKCEACLGHGTCRRCGVL